MKKRVLTILVVVVAISTLFLTGCKQQAEEETQESTTSEQTDTGKEESAGTKGKVLMLGRSVLGGWFEHWGYDYEGPVEREGYTLDYGELEVPPAIVSSAKDLVDENADQGTIVFFKLCFDDFESGSKDEMKSNLAKNKKYVQQVYDYVVKDKGLKLIIGNSLPRVKAYTDKDLVWNHRQFNKWLNQFSEDHPDEVYIFDQYSVLSDSSGNLKKEYAVDSEDSHLNGRAYSALDEKYFKFLNENF